MFDQLPSPKVGDTIKAEHIAAISKELKKRTPLNSPSVKVRETADGFYLESRGSGGSGGGSTTTFDHPWKPTLVNSEAITITAGYVNGVAASPLSLAVHATSLNYVYLEITYSLNITSGYVTSMTISSRTIAANITGLPSDTSTKKYFLLFTWQASARVTQGTYWNIGILARDDGSSTSTAEILSWVNA